MVNCQTVEATEWNTPFTNGGGGWPLDSLLLWVIMGIVTLYIMQVVVRAHDTDSTVFLISHTVRLTCALAAQNYIYIR